MWQISQEFLLRKIIMSAFSGSKRACSAQIVFPAVESTCSLGVEENGHINMRRPDMTVKDNFVSGPEPGSRVTWCDGWWHFLVCLDLLFSTLFHGHHQPLLWGPLHGILLSKKLLQWRLFGLFERTRLLNKHRIVIGNNIFHDWEQHTKYNFSNLLTFSPSSSLSVSTPSWFPSLCVTPTSSAWSWAPADYRERNMERDR